MTASNSNEKARCKGWCMHTGSLLSKIPSTSSLALSYLQMAVLRRMASSGSSAASDGTSRPSSASQTTPRSPGWHEYYKCTGISQAMPPCKINPWPLPADECSYLKCYWVSGNSCQSTWAFCDLELGLPECNLAKLHLLANVNVSTLCLLGLPATEGHYLYKGVCAKISI